MQVGDDMGSARNAQIPGGLFDHRLNALESCRIQFPNVGMHR